MAVRSKTTIFNAALTRCGRNEGSEGSGRGLWRALELNYSEIVRAAFEDGAGVYPFGRARVALTSRSEGDFGYDDAFAMPDDVIHVIEVFINERSASDLLKSWELKTDTDSLLVDADGQTVEIEYVKQGLEHTWSANFAIGVQRRLEAVIMNFLEEPEEASLKEQEADHQFRKASVKGSKNRSKRRVWDKDRGRLVRARFTRGRY